MKTLLKLMILLFTINATAQRGINYKATIKDANGNALPNTKVLVQFSVLEGDTQTNVYQENHNTTTDASGVVRLVISKGIVLSGNYSSINWANGAHFLNTQLNLGNGLVDLGTTEFLAVPYALHAENVSGLEKITENNQSGWRLIGRNPANYGNIGIEAVDLSYSNSESFSNGATGTLSIAMGNKTIASGSNSTAMGILTVASGTTATAMGFNTSASGNNASSMGILTVASGDNATAMGSNTTASGKYAIAVGNLTIASGEASTAMGVNTTASKKASIAMGKSTQASGEASTAMGYQTASLGLASTTLGRGTIAASNYSTAMGINTKAFGYGSTALGQSSIARGYVSTAMGYNTKATAMYSLAIGKNNIGNGFARLWISTDPLFEVGNGSGNTQRHNAFTILKNGKIGIGTSNPAVKLHITEGTDARIANGSGYLVLGSETGLNTVFDENEIIARANGRTSTLYLQKDGGAVNVGGSIVHSSDRRLKKNIENLGYGLNEILQLQPKSYHWKNRTQKNKSLGLIAQEVKPILKELVHTAKDKDKTLSLSYTELIPVLINAIKEQQQMIDNLKESVNQLQASNTQLQQTKKQSEYAENGFKQE